MSSIPSIYMRHLDTLFKILINNVVYVFLKFDHYPAMACTALGRNDLSFYWIAAAWIFVAMYIEIHCYSQATYTCVECNDLKVHPPSKQQQNSLCDEFNLCCCLYNSCSNLWNFLKTLKLICVDHELKHIEYIIRIEYILVFMTLILFILS